MKHGYEHNDVNNNPGAPEDFFRQLQVPHAKSREEAWGKLEQRMGDVPLKRISDFRKRLLIAGMAAMIILLAGIFSIIRFYTTTVYCPRGTHLSHMLPDGSTVDLNADSKITYKPFWWRFSRELTFAGEGYFKVEKGKKFRVISEIGTTEVLGTSFNIYSRESEYKVTCLTGKVKVTSFSSAATILTPKLTAQINAKGEISLTTESKAGEANAWINNMFSFTSRPLATVLEEIGRQYDITVTLKTPVDFLYTGYFTKNRPAEETLNLVCTPFGLNFTRISEKEFVIIQN
jgi:transmembrane sensor